MTSSISYKHANRLYNISLTRWLNYDKLNTSRLVSVNVLLPKICYRIATKQRKLPLKFIKTTKTRGSFFVRRKTNYVFHNNNFQQFFLCGEKRKFLGECCATLTSLNMILSFDFSLQFTIYSIASYFNHHFSFSIFTTISFPISFYQLLSSYENVCS